MSCGGCKEESFNKSFGEPFVIPFHIEKAGKNPEKNDRYEVYIKASAEKLDQQDEKVLMKALQEQAEFFVANGVIDYDHYSKRDRANADKYLIGEPLEVRFEKSTKTTYVHGFLYRGIEKAENIIKLLDAGSTRVGASIGGGIFAKSKEFDETLGKRVTKIQKCRWDHLALTPTSQAVLLGTQVSTMAIGSFAKSLSHMICNSNGCYWSGDFEKALEAGTATDVAQIVGGQALQKQSLERKVKKLYKKRKSLKTVPAWKKAMDDEAVPRELQAMVMAELLYV